MVFAPMEKTSAFGMRIESNRWLVWASRTYRASFFGRQQPLVSGHDEAILSRSDMMLVFIEIWLKAYQHLLPSRWLQTFESLGGSASNGLPSRTLHVDLSR